MKVFKLIWESPENIIVPSLEDMKSHLIRNWNKYFSGSNPSALPEPGTVKKIKVFQCDEDYYYFDGLEFVKSIQGAGLYGVYTLVVADMTAESILPRKIRMFAFDEIHKLVQWKDGYPQAPALEYDAWDDNQTVCNSSDATCVGNTQYYILVLCDPESRGPNSRPKKQRGDNIEGN